MISSNEIRTSFFQFFKEKGHTIVESAPVVPHDDPTLLFTNAGMNQFKDIFLGTGTRDYVRAADTQKCVRVSGKHNDLEEVGVDTYHHTYFEMLGNWSFGDYFKEEAITWAWEFLTERCHIDPSIMYATVFEGDAANNVEPDNEAANIWTSRTGIPRERVLFCSGKDNFWEMGDTGPCGPCTEIHVDRGPAACDMQGTPGHECRVNGDCARFIEIWNLVFIQYNRLPDGRLEPLPSRHVDTGMGFERLCALMNKKLSNYDTDLFTPLFDTLCGLSGHTYGSLLEKDIAFRVIGDHARTLCVAISDGVNPGNMGRGYVLRRILRRAVRFGRQVLGLRDPFMHQLAPVIATIYSEIFPEISGRLAHMEQVLMAEENAFARTIDNGIRLFEDLVAGLKEHAQLPGDSAFDLYSTYGFPKDLIELMARERKITLDQSGWNKAEAEHEKASAGKKRTFAAFDIEELDGLSPTEFCGYADANGMYRLTHRTRALRLFNDATMLVLESTPF
ncbi:alanine--tRNA ligase, partial [Myxococcota bacterium]|nr:alanine--tRNA ligase [Myxococcota bacterium]